jgi:hypothetical protein
MLLLIYGWSWFDGNEMVGLFAEHFGHNENQNRAAKPASQ